MPWLIGKRARQSFRLTEADADAGTGRARAAQSVFLHPSDSRPGTLPCPRDSSAVVVRRVAHPPEGYTYSGSACRAMDLSLPISPSTCPEERLGPFVRRIGPLMRGTQSGDPPLFGADFRGAQKRGLATLLRYAGPTRVNQPGPG
jgi:hypothetical protein